MITKPISTRPQPPIVTKPAPGPVVKAIGLGMARVRQIEGYVAQQRVDRRQTSRALRGSL